MSPELIVLLCYGSQAGVPFWTGAGLSRVPPVQRVVALWWLLRDRTGLISQFPNSHKRHPSLEKLSAWGVGWVNSGDIQCSKRGLGWLWRHVIIP